MPGRDFRDDPSTWNIGDQFLFGPSFLVNPVSESSAATRHLYLPRGKWYNFWTGDAREGGRFIDASAPLQEMPIFVKSGTILPMGPVVEYAGRTPGPIELRIYRGTDADFALYEDDGKTYDYEKGSYATIPIHWNDSDDTLFIGDRQGFPGPDSRHTFRIVLVRKGYGTGEETARESAPKVGYDGRRILTSFARGQDPVSNR